MFYCVEATRNANPQLISTSLKFLSLY